MTERVKHLRNAGIVLVLALAVYAVPGGDATGDGLANLLTVILFAGLAFFACRMYMEHRITLLDLPDEDRLLLYGSVTLAIVALLCTGRMWDGAGPLILLWFALIGVAAAGFATVARRRRGY